MIKRGKLLFLRNRFVIWTLCFCFYTRKFVYVHPSFSVQSYIIYRLKQIQYNVYCSIGSYVVQLGGLLSILWMDLYYVRRRIVVDTKYLTPCRFLKGTKPYPNPSPVRRGVIIEIPLVVGWYFCLLFVAILEYTSNLFTCQPINSAFYIPCFHKQLVYASTCQLVNLSTCCSV